MNANHYADELNNLKGQRIRVEKGLTRKGIKAGDIGVIDYVTFEPEAGFRVHFRIYGVVKVMWAANIARLRGDRFSLNTGDPTQRVVLEKTV